MTPLTNTGHVEAVQVIDVVLLAVAHADGEVEAYPVRRVGPVGVYATTTLAKQGPPVNITHIGIGLGTTSYCGGGSIHKERLQLSYCWQAATQTLAIVIGLRPTTKNGVWFYKGR